MNIGDIIDNQRNILSIYSWPEVWRETISEINIGEVKKLNDSEDQEGMVSVLKKNGRISLGILNY